MIRISSISLILVATITSGYAQYNESDTLRAIQNQFKRKHAGGIARTVAGLAFAILVATANTEPPEPTVVSTPGAPGYTLVTTYTPEHNSSVEGNIFGAVVFSAIAVTGIIQASNYSDAKLEKALELYRNEKRLWAKAPLKEKDFKVR